jgi:hypothetical protein
VIIRRRHTGNFTTIANVLFKDERLALDELGLLAWLRHCPDDWEIRRPALMRRFKIGRDGMRRIMRALLRYGWIMAQVTRLSDGRVHVIYEVRDEPGPELSEDQARSALSLVSSGAGPGESNDDDGSADGTEANGEAALPDADPGGGLPPTGQPEAASRLRPSHPGSIEDSLKTDSVKTESPKGVRAFSNVLEAWPAEHILSMVACENLHASLTDAIKEAAFQGVKPYLDDCHTQSRKVCDLATYYREKRWERFQQKKSAGSTVCAVRPGTPQWYRWREYYVATGRSTTFMDDRARSGGPLTFPSEWPPAIGSTGPPVAA